MCLSALHDRMKTYLQENCTIGSDIGLHTVHYKTYLWIALGVDEISFSGWVQKSAFTLCTTPANSSALSSHIAHPHVMSLLLAP
jgi:hypothetical protein